VRCYICDYSPHLPSIYKEGLVTHSNHRNHLLYDKLSDKYICFECHSSTRESYTDPDFPLLDIVEDVYEDELPEIISEE